MLEEYKEKALEALAENTVGIFEQVKEVIRLADAAEDEMSAWECVEKLSAKVLDKFELLKESDYKAFHFKELQPLVKILQCFTKTFPNNLAAKERYAESELLLANFLNFQKEDILEKCPSAEENAEKVRAQIRIRYEAAMEATNNIILLEDIVYCYGDWLIHIGEKQAARKLCNEVREKNPETTIFEDLGLQRSTYRIPKRNPGSTVEIVSIAALKAKSLLKFADNNVFEAANLLEIIAAIEPEEAQKISRMVSGGAPFKPLSHEHPQVKN